MDEVCVFHDAVLFTGRMICSLLLGQFFSSVCKNDSMVASHDHTHSKQCPRFGDSLHGHRYFPTWREPYLGIVPDRCKNNMRSDARCEGSILLAQSLSVPLSRSSPTPMSTEIHAGDIQRNNLPTSLQTCQHLAAL